MKVNRLSCTFPSLPNIAQDIQAPYYPEFAVNNTYGIKAINDTIYTQMKTAYSRPGGCKDQIAACRDSDRSTLAGQQICSRATTFCRNNVESPYYTYGGRGVYDIRHPYDDPTPPDYFMAFLNTSETQEALGVNINYTTTNSRYVSQGFASTGDFVFPDFKKDLEEILDWGVRVALLYGDADYVSISPDLSYNSLLTHPRSATGWAVKPYPWNSITATPRNSKLLATRPSWSTAPNTVLCVNMGTSASQGFMMQGMRFLIISQRRRWNTLDAF